MFGDAEQMKPVRSRMPAPGVCSPFP
jgi:hypothetical protein